MSDPPNSIFVQGSKQQDEDEIRLTVGMSRIMRHIASFLSSHKRAYRIAQAINVVYGKIVGRVHILPNAYIIGFQKCGTTALYTYLVEHPQIHPSFMKEVRYFDKNERYQRGLNWYRSNFPLNIQKMIYEWSNKKKFVSIDASPSYVDHPHAKNRIAKIAPDAKFIVMIRNPIDRAYSHHNMNFNKVHRITDDLSFDEAIKQEKSRIDGEYERMEDDETYDSKEYFRYAYAHRGLYARRLKDWLTEFPGQVLVLESDLLVNDRQETFDRVTDFLGIDRHKLRDTVARNVGDYRRGKIDEAIRKYLVEYYRKPNEELYSLLGRNLGWD